MSTYTQNMNAAIRGELSRAFGNRSSKPRKGMTLTRHRLMKMARYLSRSIHGK
ncbi:TPA: hypothetical protein ACID9U_003597 [Pseudomonas aeruginosa]|uniref:hypothetical protein n=1 Tax=Pseudomonas aeruginosa TaxID=287 RepID=UPI000211FCF0|nr:hypothetical protein [Pseudomonas aeruginosa]EIU1295306.1 hypothetical protein [Pseudomonas aeruginosa]EIU1441026.1 hypothetical protein [Pseudomonas aeruginosa]EIU3133600.1 hypothetical protein [Pseudomonas aeruginosa]EIU3952025.1 hypothetical protein [Pseudomonas aeruginosa]EIU3962435.1 hypothetical protein [Pseudomonas aeruginosa]